MTQLSKSEMVKMLRDDSGAGMCECKAVLEKCEWDYLLAEGYLRYYGCAVNTYDVPHEEWAMTGAQAYKRLRLGEISEENAKSTKS